MRKSRRNSIHRPSNVHCRHRIPLKILIEFKCPTAINRRAFRKICIGWWLMLSNENWFENSPFDWRLYSNLSPPRSLIKFPWWQSWPTTNRILCNVTIDSLQIISDDWLLTANLAEIKHSLLKKPLTNLTALWIIHPRTVIFGSTPADRGRPTEWSPQ